MGTLWVPIYNARRSKTGTWVPILYDHRSKLHGRFAHVEMHIQRVDESLVAKNISAAPADFLDYFQNRPMCLVCYIGYCNTGGSVNAPMAMNVQNVVNVGAQGIVYKITRSWPNLFHNWICGCVFGVQMQDVTYFAAICVSRTFIIC